MTEHFNVDALYFRKKKERIEKNKIMRIDLNFFLDFYFHFYYMYFFFVKNQPQ